MKPEFHLALLAAGSLLCGIAAGLASASPVTLPTQVGGYTLEVPGIRELRFRSTVHQRYDFSCGSAALSTLLTHHYDHPVTEAEVFEEMFRLGNQAKIRHDGFSMLDMKRYLVAHGFEADGFEAPLAQLQKANIPAIALITEHGYHHFVVIKGVSADRVLVGDPAAGTRVVPRAAFEQVWANHVLFVVTSGQRAAFNLASDWAATPTAPLVSGVDRQGLGQIVMPKFGASDF
jgi:predicted double-glycine peptidase